mmetsp:Transcript_22099/g.59625  ORF Transcript_22099/g.59625 Transcript_22099/m.59625 type:complete len:216 (+) Transcript_22099:1208-1855(+)
MSLDHGSRMSFSRWLRSTTSIPFISMWAFQMRRALRMARTLQVNSRSSFTGLPWAPMLEPAHEVELLFLREDQATPIDAVLVQLGRVVNHVLGQLWPTALGLGLCLVVRHSGPAALALRHAPLDGSGLLLVQLALPLVFRGLGVVRVGLERLELLLLGLAGLVIARTLRWRAERSDRQRVRAHHVDTRGHESAGEHGRAGGYRRLGHHRRARARP